MPEAKYIIGLFAGFTIAAVFVAWAMLEYRREPDRFPLIEPFDRRFLVVIIPVIIVFSGAWWATLSWHPGGKGSTLVAVGTNVWLLISFGSGLLAVVGRAQRRFALGWLAIVDERTFRVEIDGTIETIALRPGSVSACLTPTSQCLQFEIVHEAGTLVLLARVTLRDLNLMTRNVVVVPPRGRMIGVSGKRFCRMVRPYMARN